MKYPWLALCFAAIAGVNGWMWYSAEQRVNGLEQQLDIMNEHVLTLEKQIVALEEQYAKVSDRSIDGILDDASSILVEGWETLLGNFQRELNKAKKHYQESLPKEQESQ